MGWESASGTFDRKKGAVVLDLVPCRQDGVSQILDTCNSSLLFTHLGSHTGSDCLVITVEYIDPLSSPCSDPCVTFQNDMKKLFLCNGQRLGLGSPLDLKSCRYVTGSTVPCS